MNFNSHAHVERDLFHKKSSKTISHFNSHAHVERDRSALSYVLSFFYFNSHAHVERDFVMSLSFFVISSFQLTRSRGA